MTTTTKTATVTEADIEKYLAAKEEVSFKYNKAGAKIWYHARAIIGTGAIDNGKFAGWSVDHDVKINRYEAALYLEKYGLTVEQFVAAEKEFYATRYPKDEATAEDNVEAIAETDGSEEDDDESFTANVMPDEDDGSDDELIDPPDFQTVERNSGNYGTWINGEYVRFENHSIVYIDADRKRGFHFCKVNGKKFFYRQCGHKIAAAKIIERYMNGEIAAEQSKAISDFFYAHKLEVGNPFKVSFEITTADGQEHFFSRTFDTFAEAKALVDEFTSTFSEPTLIVITQNKQGGDWYYSRDVDGTEKFFDAFCKMNSAAELKAEEKNFTANCYYTYTKDGDKRNGLESKKFATATEAAIWILNYVRENGYTLADGTNIRDCTDRKEYFMSESDFSAAEVEPGKKSTAKVDRLDELKAKRSSLISAISHSLENHFIKLDNGEFVNASDAGFTTFGIDSARPEFDKLYFKDDSGEYVEVPKKSD